MSPTKRPLASSFVLTAALASALLAAPTRQARAALTLSLTPNVLTAAPGSLLSFSALLQNTGAESVSLTGAGSNITGPSMTALTFDDTDFLNNLPLALAANATYTRNLFVTVASNAPLGVYTGTYTVDGEGATSATPFSGSASARITIAQAPAQVIPEPGSASLLLIGLATFGGTGRLVQRRGGKNGPQQGKTTAR